jgi:class 3 adenylate cyclase/tetratricopeptide (TPR) repeat protein
MECPRCHAENRDGLRFCEDCGSRLTLTCAQCGGELAPGKRFCGSCGAPTVGQSATRTLAPESYTPKHLAERILTSKAALEGERKQVTVLFADLKGSMELLADRDPEEARKLLDPVLERMMEAVHRYEGTVNQVMGDGIMALFGAPVAHEDHAVRACYAAHDMQAAMRRYTPEVRQTHGVEMQIRVGPNSGEVVVRAIGSDLRMDYTAVGQTTHLAARMEQLAPPGTIRLTADTLRLAEGYLEVKPLGPVPVKGLETPVEVYEMVGTGPRRSRLHAAAVRGLTRFVGRETELEALRQALARSASGHGQVVAMVGEPGVGKSRLVWEVTHSHRVHGWLVLHAGSVSYGKATTYLPVIDLLKGYFAIEARDGLRGVQEKITGKLLTLDRALEPSLPALLTLLDVPNDDPQWLTLDPAQRRRRTLDAIKRLLLRESQGQPLLVVFEDLHWIDSETQALLEGLVESLPAARMLLLVNYRPEYQHAWGSRTYYTQLRLDPLPPEGAEELLRALLGPDAGFDPLKRVLIARTDGNPFFLEESVQTLVETGALAGERGAFRLARPLPTIQVPATVQAVLAARIDRLAPGDKALLQTASVIGKDVPFALLQAVAELSEDDLDAALGRLQAAEFLYEASILPDLEYTFKHALTHEVTYGGLLQERRRALHARIVETAERFASERLADQVEWLGHHAFRGAVWDKAVAYLRSAGLKATAQGAGREARTFFEEALVALEHLGSDSATRTLGIDLRCELEDALMLLGAFETSLDRLREAETLARTCGDRGRLGWVLGKITYNLASLGDLAGALEAGEHAAAALTDPGQRQYRLTVNVTRARARYGLGDYRQGIEICRESESLFEAPGPRRVPGPTDWFTGVYIRIWRVLCLAELGQFVEAGNWGDRAIREVETRSLGPPEQIWVYVGVGRLHVVCGAFEQAITVLEPAMRMFEGGALTVYLPRIASALGTAYVHTGRVAGGLALLEQADATGRSIQFRYGQSLVLTQLGEACLLAGDRIRAEESATKAVTLAREGHARGSEAYARQLLGKIAAYADPLDTIAAEMHYHGALTLAEERGMRPLIAHCHLGLGKLYQRTGDSAKAKEHLTTATTLYREMGMGFYLAQADAAGAGGDP